MISRHRKTIDYINITFDKNFINSLSLLSKKLIEPITENVNNKEMIIGIKIPVSMEEETFDRDKKIIESDILKAFADIINSEICNANKQKNSDTDDIADIDDRNKVSKTRKIKNENLMPCPYCESINTISYGTRNTNVAGLKQKRLCKDCKKSYTVQEKRFWKMKNSPQIIEDALKLSESLSLRNTAEEIMKKYNIKISHSTIMNWKRNLMNMVK